MLADLEALIPSACLAVGFVMLIKTIFKHQNPRRRAANRAREAAAEAADPRIMHDQVALSELKPIGGPGAKGAKTPAKKKPATKVQTKAKA